jgi:hypothetical protein
MRNRLSEFPKQNGEPLHVDVIKLYISLGSSEGHYRFQA